MADDKPFLDIVVEKLEVFLPKHLKHHASKILAGVFFLVFILLFGWLLGWDVAWVLFVAALLVFAVVVLFSIIMRLIRGNW